MNYLALGVIAGLAAVERKGFLQAMLSRPISLGAFAGLALGNVAAGLFVAAPLELLWLGSVNMGAALPVNEALGTVAIAGGTVLGERTLLRLGLSGPKLLPAVAVLAVACCAPLALVGRRTDRLVERWNERLFERAERELVAGAPEAAARTNLYGLMLPFGISFLLAPLGAAAAAALIAVVARWVEVALPALGLGWVAFAGFACASGARAMRAERAHFAYLAAIGIGLAAFAATALAGGRA